MQPALTATAFRAAAVVDGGQDVELFEDRGLAKGLEWPGNIWEHLGKQVALSSNIMRWSCHVKLMAKDSILILLIH
jgi:hypothetical protein